MKKEILRYKQLGIIPLLVLFFAIYIVVILIFSLLNDYVNLGVGPFLVKLFVFYVFLMYLLRVQLHSYEFVFHNKQLIIKEYLSKREKTLAVIPLNMIVTISMEKKHNDRYYHKRKKFIKRHIKNTRMFYIEYDDSTDISLVQLQTSEEFYEALCKAR